MKRDTLFHFVPQIIILIVVSALLVSQSGYFPFNAIRSLQIVRMGDANNTDNVSLQEINLLKKAILMSPGNCRAYLLLGDRFVKFMFPKYDNDLGYTSLLHQKGKYDETQANEVLVILDSGLERCYRYQYQIHFYRGYLYYLMDKPDLALPELESLKKLKPYSSPILAYEVMSEVYADLQEPINAGVALIFSMASEHKDAADEDIKKIEKINQYLKSVPIIPNRNAGFGRYSTATIVNNHMSYFGALSGDTSALVYLDGNNINKAKVLNAGNNVQLSTILDKEGHTHIAYLFGDRYIIYSNSKDNFTEKTVIDTHSTTPTLVGKPFSIDLYSVELAIDDENNPQIVWSYESGYIGYLSLENNKSTHNSEIIASDGAYPDIEILRNGIVGIVYNNLTVFPAQSTQVIYKEKNSDGWKDSINISKSSQWAGAANLVSDEYGIPHVFYITGSTSENVVLMHVTSDIHGNWLQPEVIASNNYRPMIPTLSAGSQVNFGGRTAPSVVLLSNNRIAVVWRGAFINDSTQIFGRIFSGNEWQPIEILGKIPGQDFNDTQSIIMQNDNLDTITLVWSDNGNLVFHTWIP